MLELKAAFLCIKDRKTYFRIVKACTEVIVGYENQNNAIHFYIYQEEKLLSLFSHEFHIVKKSLVQNNVNRSGWDKITIQLYNTTYRNEKKNYIHKNNSTAQHWQRFSNASVCEGIQRLRVLNAHRLMSHLRINLSLEQEDRGKKGGKKQNTWLLPVQMERGAMIVDHRCGNCAMWGRQNEVFWLAGGSRVQCSVKRYSGRGRGVKILGQRELCKQEFPGGDERVSGRIMNSLLPFFPLSGLSFNIAAVQLNNITFYILLI